jgi:hypothetical protein
MTGISGFPSGAKFLKRRCKCGKIFFGEEKLCDECHFKRNYVKVGRCILENAEGRCKDFFKCKNYDFCLEEASKRNWEGWRRCQ